MRILFLLMICSTCFAKYEEFIHPSPNNNGHYVWIEVPVQLLDSVVPDQAKNSRKNIVRDNKGDVVSYENKRILEYLTLEPIISNDGKTAIVLLSERHSPRIHGVSEADIEFWDQHLTPYGLGYNTGKWMGLDGSPSDVKVSGRRKSGDYPAEEL